MSRSTNKVCEVFTGKFNTLQIQKIADTLPDSIYIVTVLQDYTPTSVFYIDGVGETITYTDFSCEGTTYHGKLTKSSSEAVKIMTRNIDDFQVDDFMSSED